MHISNLLKTTSIDYIHTYNQQRMYNNFSGKTAVSNRQARHSLAVSSDDFTHHNYTAMEQFLKDLSETYPELTRLYSIGKSVEGRELYVLEVTKDPGSHLPGR